MNIVTWIKCGVGSILWVIGGLIYTIISILCAIFILPFCSKKYTFTESNIWFAWRPVFLEDEVLFWKIPKVVWLAKVKRELDNNWWEDYFKYYRIKEK